VCSYRLILLGSVIEQACPINSGDGCDLVGEQGGPSAWTSKKDDAVYMDVFLVVGGEKARRREGMKFEEFVA